MTDQAGASLQIHTIKLWIKAFVPSTSAGVQIVPAGDHAGKTMLTTLWMINRCFLTDNRTFSPELHAEARMHSEIEIDVVKKKLVYEFHHCYETVEIDCETGAEKGRAHAKTDHMHFTNFNAAENGQTFTVEINASSRNPRLKIATKQVSPNIDLRGKITVALNWDATDATVRFEGLVEPYPAFEMYAAFNGSETGMPIFQVDIEPGATVANISGAPTRTINTEMRVVL